VVLQALHVADPLAYPRPCGRTAANHDVEPLIFEVGSKLVWGRAINTDPEPERAMNNVAFRCIGRRAEIKNICYLGRSNQASSVLDVLFLSVSGKWKSRAACLDLENPPCPWSKVPPACIDTGSAEQTDMWCSLFTHHLCFIDDPLRTAHFSTATQSTSSMPVLIRSNTISLLDRASTLDQRDHITSTLPHKTRQMDRRNNMMEQRTMDHRTSATDQRDHRTSTMDQRSKTMDRGCRVKDGQSRKLSMWVLAKCSGGRILRANDPTWVSQFVTPVPLRPDPGSALTQGSPSSLNQSQGFSLSVWILSETPLNHSSSGQQSLGEVYRVRVGTWLLPSVDEWMWLDGDEQR